jgi:hypothetical protein
MEVNYMKKVRQLLTTSIFLVAFALLLPGNVFSQVCPTNNVNDVQYQKFNADYNTFKVYPSMSPRSYLKVSYDFLESTPDLPSYFIFDPNNWSNFIIVKDGETDLKKRLKVERIDNFAGVRYIVLDAKSNGLKKGDKINVGLCTQRRSNSQNVLFWDTDDNTSKIRATTEITKIDNYTLILTPDIVPEQELIDGSKRDVGHVNFKFDVPSIVRNTSGARLYFNTENVISTDWKDKASKLEMKFGAERSLLRNWYVPGNIEAKVNGDQRMKNSTLVLSGGVKTILPWAWTKKALYNSFIRAPISPVIGINAEYHNRLKQYPLFGSNFPQKSSFALSSEFNWLPIKLFANCKSDDKDQVKGDAKKKDAEFDECVSADRISLELSAKGWWFPRESTLTGEKVRKLEGRAEISLLIPVGNIANQFLFKNEKEKITSRIRLKYVTGANDAAGFKRSSVFTYGIELIP